MIHTSLEIVKHGEDSRIVNRGAQVIQGRSLNELTTTFFYWAQFETRIYWVMDPASGNWLGYEGETTQGNIIALNPNSPYVSPRVLEAQFLPYSLLFTLFKEKWAGQKAMEGTQSNKIVADIPLGQIAPGIKVTQWNTAAEFDYPTKQSRALWFKVGNAWLGWEIMRRAEIVIDAVEQTELGLRRKRLPLSNHWVVRNPNNPDFVALSAIPSFNDYLRLRPSFMNPAFEDVTTAEFCRCASSLMGLPELRSPEEMAVFGVNNSWRRELAFGTIETPDGEGFVAVFNHTRTLIWTPGNRVFTRGLRSYPDDARRVVEAFGRHKLAIGDAEPAWIDEALEEINVIF